jgi:hypothetical protein
MIPERTRRERLAEPWFHRKDTPYDQISGYIIEAKGGLGDRPFSIKACKTERVESYDCDLMLGSVGPAKATFLKAAVLSEAGQATHAGRFSNEGVFLVDPATGAVTGTGTASAANGDALLWVYSGALDAMGVAQGSVFFCGGDGQFDAAVGGFTVNVKESSPDPADPQVVHECYSGQGVIRY